MCRRKTQRRNGPRIRRDAEGKHRVKLWLDWTNYYVKLIRYCAELSATSHLILLLPQMHLLLWVPSLNKPSFICHIFFYVNVKHRYKVPVDNVEDYYSCFYGLWNSSYWEFENWSVGLVRQSVGILPVCVSALIRHVLTLLMGWLENITSSNLQTHTHTQKKPTSRHLACWWQRYALTSHFVS